jgi:hypothetical protein
MSEVTQTTADPTISVDGVEYPLSSFSDNAKAQLTNLQVVDAEIARLQQSTAIAQTARLAYANALKAELPSSE